MRLTENWFNLFGEFALAANVYTNSCKSCRAKHNVLRYQDYKRMTKQRDV